MVPITRQFDCHCGQCNTLEITKNLLVNCLALLKYEKVRGRIGLSSLEWSLDGVEASTAILTLEPRGYKAIQQEPKKWL